MNPYVAFIVTEAACKSATVQYGLLNETISPEPINIPSAKLKAAVPASRERQIPSVAVVHIFLTAIHIIWSPVATAEMPP